MDPETFNFLLESGTPKILKKYMRFRKAITLEERLAIEFRGSFVIMTIGGVMKK
jgi:hypothetical protein